jgi:hypothetical protein
VKLLFTAASTSASAPSSNTHCCASFPAVLPAVCGQDGITYPSKCDMECFGVKLAHKGECEKEGTPTPSESSAQDGCMCAEIFMPVCGSDNVTYPNGELLLGNAVHPCLPDGCFCI